MSTCGGNCQCGSGCKCGNGCGMYPDVEKSPTVTIIEGVAPLKTNIEGSEKNTGTAEGGHACKCGSSCACNPCTC